jgi:hypothetical protein
MKDRVQQKRERLNQRSKVKRALIRKITMRVRAFRVKRGTVLALVIRRVKNQSMARETLKPSKL